MEGYPAAKDFILLALALYGAILSTINWRSQARRDAAQFVIRTMTAACDSPSPYARVEAINVGHRTVMIDILTLELPSGARLFTPHANDIVERASTRLPATLRDGEAAQYVVSCEE